MRYINPGLPPEESGKNHLYSTYRLKSKRRNIPFDLDKETFFQLTSSNCFYCGKPPTKVSRLRKTVGHHGDYKYNGIDRVDNDKGYIEGNCVACCYDCNLKKKNISIDMARKVIEFIDKQGLV